MTENLERACYDCSFGSEKLSMACLFCVENPDKPNFKPKELNSLRGELMPEKRVITISKPDDVQALDEFCLLVANSKGKAVPVAQAVTTAVRVAKANICPECYRESKMRSCHCKQPEM